MESLALHLNKMGACALCVHPMTRFYQDALPDKFWIDMTRELMRRADAVVVGPNWQTSSGTLGEIAEAKERNMPIFYFDDPEDWESISNDNKGVEQFLDS